MRKAFPGLRQRFAGLPDPRRQEFCRYSGSHIWWAGTLLFLTRAGSRNAFDQTRNSGHSPENMGAFCGQMADDPRFEGQPLVTCTDNLAHHLERVEATEPQDIPTEMVEGLLTQRRLERARLPGGWYGVLFDGTVQEKCREGFEEGGKTGGRAGTRYRYVLQCGLLGPQQTFLPFMYESVDMHDPVAQKEDCELKAFFRLARRLKNRFPRMKFCVIGDALFCTEAIVERCQTYGWKYVVTLKEGRQPGAWEELLHLLPLCPENSLRLWRGQDGKEGLRDFRWVEHIPMGRHETTVVLSGEFIQSEASLFVYATNFSISKENVAVLIPATGRDRHLVEDYFNTAKNNGVGLGHVFCAKANASKNFFTLMQIAALLWTLICHSYLMRVFDWASRATEMALAHALAEGMRSYVFPMQLPEPGQLRFVS